MPLGVMNARFEVWPKKINFALRRVENKIADPDSSKHRKKFFPDFCF
jgi:hypothetical protein